MKRLPLLLLAFILTSCANYGQLEFVTELQKKLDENSGLAVIDSENPWFIEDSGNSNSVYQTNLEGKIIRKIKLYHVHNKDWEELASDKQGNLYIGDIGNNSNNRDDLRIFKIPNPNTIKADSIHCEVIAYVYPEQKKFPPKKKNRYYDAEAMFHKDSSLYIITKNHTKPFDGKALVYKIPDYRNPVDEDYKAELLGDFISCEEKQCKATAADISPDGKTVVVLTYGKLLVFTKFKSIDTFFKGKKKVIDLGTNTQLESVCFIDGKTLYLSDEDQGVSGRNLYRLKLK